jgi:hypothetical protein
MHVMRYAYLTVMLMHAIRKSLACVTLLTDIVHYCNDAVSKMPPNIKYTPACTITYLLTCTLNTQVCLPVCSLNALADTVLQPGRNDSTRLCMRAWLQQQQQQQ